MQIELARRSLRIDTMAAYLDGLAGDPTAALSRLQTLDTPESLRQRLSLLLAAHRYEEAAALVAAKKPDEEWCDVAIHGLLLGGYKSAADDLLVAVRQTFGSDKEPVRLRCILAYSETILVQAFANRKSPEVSPGSLSEIETGSAREAIAVIENVLQRLRADGVIKSFLEMCIALLGLKAHFLLSDHVATAELASLLLTYHPVPLDVVPTVRLGILTCPSDLPDRIRIEHPESAQAGVLAAMLEAECLSLPSKAFDNAMKVVALAKTADDRRDIAFFLVNMSAVLSDEHRSQAWQRARVLLSDSPSMLALLEVDDLLKHDRVAEAGSLLEATHDPDDPVWLQLRARTLLARGETSEASKLLCLAAEKTLNPDLLRRAGELSVLAEQYDQAITAFHMGLAVNPRDHQALHMLGVLHAQKGDYKAAVGCFRALSSLMPSDEQCRLNLAVSLREAGHYDESLDVFSALCAPPSPSLQAVFGKVQLLRAMGDSTAAFRCLVEHKSEFWERPEFVSIWMDIGYSAGQDENAHEGLLRLNELQSKGRVDTKTLKEIPSATVHEFFLEARRDTQIRSEYLHTEMLRGRMPWVWAAKTANEALYWGWRNRTQELDWIGEEPTNRAQYCIYATNGFHPGDAEEEDRTLLPLECPPKGTSVVADVSALITLHRLGLLDKAAAYFGEILVPAGYLATVLEDSRTMVLHQRSRQTAAELITREIDAGRITVLPEGVTAQSDTTAVDEYSEVTEHRYRLVDVVGPIHVAGLLDDRQHASVLHVCHKGSAIDDAHPTLKHLQNLVIGLSTLETIAQFEVLDAACGYFRLFVTDRVRHDLTQRLRVIELQEETRRWHMDLWTHLRGDLRFKLVPHTVPEDMRSKETRENDFLAFLASFVARERRVPLLVDDRVCQAFTLNEVKGVPLVPFGSDALLTALMAEDGSTTGELVDAYLQLMSWRYRFLVPSAAVLKALADRHRTHPPGRELQEVAEYVHDCMRDPGLFGGREKTQMGESMAMRTFLAWVASLAEFVVLVWADNGFTPEAATRLTGFVCTELLPSIPLSVVGRAKSHAGEMIPRLVLSRALIGAIPHAGEPRMADALKVIKDAFELSDEEYHRIVLDSIAVAGKSNPNASEEERTALQALRKRMRNYAFLHVGRAGPRALTALQDLDLFTPSPGEAIGSDMDADMVRDSKHPHRVPLPAGPLLLYHDPQSPRQRFAVEVPVLLFSDLPTIRETALGSLERSILDGNMEVTPKTKTFLEARSKAILSDQPHVWRPAAMALFDALDDDLLVALQGARQSLQCTPMIQDSLNKYAERVFRPTVSSMESIIPPVWDAVDEHSSLVAIIDHAVEGASGLSDACARYHARLGYLPLAPAYSLAEVVSRWLAKNPFADAWTEVWAWARGASGPLPRYHACAVFVLHSEWVPDGKLSELWMEILAVLNPPTDKDGKPSEQDRWTMRRDLVRHFLFHLEAHLPETEGNKIANFAWWFAERVAGLFPDDAKSAQFYGKNWIEHAADISARVWLAASPRVGPSRLRYVTLCVSSPWATALLCLMGTTLERLAPEQQPHETQVAFHNALLLCAIGSLPFAVEAAADPTYAQELPLEQTVLKWAVHAPENHPAALKQLAATSRTLGSVEGLCAALKDLAAKSFVEQINVTIALKAKAYTDTTIADGIWAVVSDAEWRKGALEGLQLQVLGNVEECFHPLLMEHGGLWASRLPHFLAELAEKAEDEERRNVLFLYVVHLSLASDTVSAVRRLLRGDQKAKFAPLAVQYRKRLEDVWAVYPGWVQGRLRGLLANLRVV